MSKNPNYQDGYARPDQETTVFPVVRYPYSDSATPDVFSKTYERSYNVLPTLYAPRIANRTSFTNLVTYSELFSNAAWTATAVTPTVVTTPAAPDGQATLNKLLETSATSEHSIAQAATVAASAAEATVFAQSGLGRTVIKLSYVDSGSTTFSGFFDIDGGNIGVLSAGVTARIVPLGASQFQCILGFTPAAGAGTLKVNVSSGGTTISYAGDATKGVYLWGAQIVNGSNAPYISTTTATRAVSSPDRELTINTNAAAPDPFAYLVKESDPGYQVSALAKVQRTFARIPKQQVIPDDLYIAKPDIPGTFPQVLGAFLIFKPISTVASYDGYLTKIVTSDSGAITGFYPTGGTYTLTFSGSTTASINYNDNAATVQTRLNALTPVSNRGNVTVTGSYNTAAGFTITFGNYAAATIDSTNLVTTGTGFATQVTNVNSGYTQSIATATNPNAFMTGGTFTITIFGQTTAAIAYNATAAAVQSALNLLSNVSNGGGCVVTVPEYQVNYPNFPIDITDARFYGGVRTLRFSISFSNAAITGTSSLTPVGATLTPTISDGTIGRVQNLTFASPTAIRTLFVSGGHGISGGDTIYLKADGVYYPSITAFTATDANNLTITANATYSAATAITEIGKRALVGYTPTSVETRVKYVTDFYLPGVSPGITTLDDIPLPTFQGDPATLLAAIFSGSTSINYQVGGLKQAIGPILQRTITTIDATQL